MDTPNIYNKSNTHKKIYAFTGSAGSGKDTACEIICKYLNLNGQTSIEILAFAKPIKDACKILFNLTDDQLYDPLLKEVIDHRYNKSPREILQWVGTDMLRKNISEDFFINHMKERIRNSNKEFILITDVRFDNEAELVKSIGGKVIKIKRINKPLSWYSSYKWINYVILMILGLFNTLSDFFRIYLRTRKYTDHYTSTKHSKHSSEMGISDSLVDVIIYNDGTLSEYEKKVMETFHNVYKKPSGLKEHKEPGPKRT